MVRRGRTLDTVKPVLFANLKWREGTESKRTPMFLASWVEWKMLNCKEAEEEAGWKFSSY